MGNSTGRNVCVLTEIQYNVEFIFEPSEVTIQALVSSLKKDEDRLQWDIDGDESADDFFNPESTHRLKVFLEVRPCSQSSGVEGDFDDIDDEATPRVTMDFFFVWCFFCREAISAAPMGDRLSVATWGSSHEAEDRKAKPATLISRRALATTRSGRRTTDHGRGETTVRPWWISPRRWPRRQLSL